jgi:hypothetical protein
MTTARNGGNRSPCPRTGLRQHHGRADQRRSRCLKAHVLQLLSDQGVSRRLRTGRYPRGAHHRVCRPRRGATLGGTQRCHLVAGTPPWPATAVAARNRGYFRCCAGTPERARRHARDIRRPPHIGSRSRRTTPRGGRRRGCSADDRQHGAGHRTHRHEAVGRAAADRSRYAGSVR